MKASRNAGCILICAAAARQRFRVSPAGSRLLESAARNMSSRSNERFVADESSRWWKSAEGEKVRRQIEDDVSSRYRAEFKGAGWFKQLLLKYRMRREIAAECARVTLETLWAKQ